MALASLDQFQFHHTLAETDGPVLVLFSAPHCGSCRHWRALLADFAPPEPVAVFVVDVQQDPALAQEFAIVHLPALFLYKDGEFHAHLQALARPDALWQAIAASLSLPPEEVP